MNIVDTYNIIINRNALTSLDQAGFGSFNQNIVAIDALVTLLARDVVVNCC